MAEWCIGAWLQVWKTGGGDAALTSPWLTCVFQLLPRQPALHSCKVMASCLAAGLALAFAPK